MIVGNDISNYQGQLDWVTYIQNSNFVICKSSEGTSYIDTWFGYNRAEARQYKIARGWYHFARPDYGNSPEAEAQFFCNLMNGEPLQEGEIVALDYEVQYSDPVGWCKKWLDFVSQNLGVKPLIYLNQSTAEGYDWQPVVDAGYGLWIAAYTYDPTNNNFKTGKWPFAAMQQWTDRQNVPGASGELDGDVFFGDSKAFGAYGYHKPVEVVTPPVEIPVEVTSPQSNSGTTGTSSANSTTTIDIPVTTSQTFTSQPPQKPSNPLGWLIAFLKFLWTGKRG